MIAVNASLSPPAYRDGHDNPGGLHVTAIGINKTPTMNFAGTSDLARYPPTGPVFYASVQPLRHFS